MKQDKNPIELREIPYTFNDNIRFFVKDKATVPTYHMHWHENIEIQYIIEGTNIARCENDIIEASEDSFYIINSGELHQSIGGKRRHALIQFSPALFEKQNIVLKRLVRDPYLSDIVHKMIDEYYRNDEFSKFNIQGYSYLLITHLYRNHSYKTVDYDSYSQKQITLNKCIKYIHDNYKEDISLETVAAMANISKYHFCNIFKEFTGHTFKEYHNRLRISKAIELLSNTNIPITEIAFLCGFNDSNYFSRKFHQITGKTPLAARAKLAEQEDFNLKWYY